MKIYFFTMIVLTQFLFSQRISLADSVSREYQDSGVIGEQKTKVSSWSVIPFNGGKIVSSAGGSLVTPVVIGDDAIFGGEIDGSFHLRYGFKLACMGWHYHIKAHWLNPYMKKDSGWFVDLESPDRKTSIHTKILDLPLSASFYRPLTEEQIREERANQEKEDQDNERLKAKGIFIGSRAKIPYADPLDPKERVLAGKGVIRGLLATGVDGYNVPNLDNLQYIAEPVGQKDFIKVETDVCQGTHKKKAAIWSLNIRGYRSQDGPDERRIEAWVCELVSNPAEFESNEVKTAGILNTLRFSSKDRYIYQSLRDSESTVH